MVTPKGWEERVWVGAALPKDSDADAWSRQGAGGPGQRGPPAGLDMVGCGEAVAGRRGLYHVWGLDLMLTAAPAAGAPPPLPTFI